MPSFLHFRDTSALGFLCYDLSAGVKKYSVQNVTGGTG